MRREAKNDREAAFELCITLSRAYRSVMEHSNRDVRKYGLNPTEFGVLEFLFHRGPQPLQQIGEKILLASGSITYVVDRLQDKGYLRREPCPRDRRVIYAVLTERGEALLQDIFPQHAVVLEKAVAGLNFEEKRQVIHLLKKLGFHAQETLSS